MVYANLEGLWLTRNNKQTQTHNETRPLHALNIDTILGPMMNAIGRTYHLFRKKANRHFDFLQVITYDFCCSAPILKHEIMTTFVIRDWQSLTELNDSQVDPALTIQVYEVESAHNCITVYHKNLHLEAQMYGHSVGFRLCVGFEVCILVRESFIPSSQFKIA